jgi:hypothetical protein
MDARARHTSVPAQGHVANPFSSVRNASESISAVLTIQNGQPILGRSEIQNGPTGAIMGRNSNRVDVESQMLLSSQGQALTGMPVDVARIAVDAIMARLVGDRTLLADDTAYLAKVVWLWNGAGKLSKTGKAAYTVHENDNGKPGYVQAGFEEKGKFLAEYHKRSGLPTGKKYIRETSWNHVNYVLRVAGQVGVLMGAGKGKKNKGKKSDPLARLAKAVTQYADKVQPVSDADWDTLTALASKVAEVTAHLSKVRAETAARAAAEAAREAAARTAAA